jgi:multidrug efflux pump subunit AcrA (membrane-fusion protein)
MENPGRKWLFFVPVLIGAGAFVLLSKNREAPQQHPPSEQAVAARVISIPSVPLVPRITADGSVAPANVWQAQAQVSGTLNWVSPNLSTGKLLRANEPLIRIDDRDYQLALAQADAALAATQAQLDELTTREQNTRASLAIEEEALALGERELTRQRDLLNKGTLSRSAFDTQTRSVLQQRQSVQAQRNALSLFPAERRLREAELARLQAQREQAARDIARCEIRAPFDARVASAALVAGEYVQKGAALAELDDIAVAEIEVRLPLRQMQALAHMDRPLQLAEAGSLPAQLFSASVRLPNSGSNGSASEWPARVDRLAGGLDARTRTVGVIVAVDKPYANAQPGARPPLVKGMFVEVELRGLPREPLPLVPRDALHAGKLYLLDGEDRLRAREVELALELDGYAAIASGAAAGDRLILSDLLPASDGRLIEPVDDPQALARLLAEAGAEAAK